jgi:hypothetical protein
VVVNFKAREFKVTATASGGHGTVSPATQTVDHGGAATIYLNPDTGYHASSITDNGAAVPVSDPYVIKNVNATHNVVVTYATDKWPVDAWVEGGHGTVDPASQLIDNGNNATINFHPDVGYHVETVTHNGELVPGPYGPTYTVTGVTEDHDIVVTFDIDEFTVDAAVGTGSGAVDPLSQTVSYGGVAVIDITPAAGYHIDSIIDGGAVPITDPYVIENVKANHSVVVNFGLNDYSVTARVDGGHGTVDVVTPTVADGGTATITYAPEATYTTATITDNGALMPGPYTGTYTIPNVHEDHLVVVTYKLSDYIVAASVAGAHGSVGPPTQIIEAGDPATVSISPAAGYHTAAIVDNNVLQPGPYGPTYTIGSVTADHSVVFSFAADQFTVTADAI